MNKLEQSQYIPIVECQMKIRKPSSVVFQAFIDPSITTRFWMTKSSGILQEGETVTWEWEMYNASMDVQVLQITNNQLIATKWGNPSTSVDYHFEALNENECLVVIKNYGFHEKGNELIEVVKDRTGGFTTVLDGLKAYLEHGIELNLVLDKFPSKELPNGKQE